MQPRIVGLEIVTKYNSIINNSVQTIKLEISFRKKLRNPTKMKVIKHEFIDALGEPILIKDVEIEVIDLTENFAEKLKEISSLLKSGEIVNVKKMIQTIVREFVELEK
ncbi:nucleotidyl transferase AbiEii/AbiGii toxin family protein [Candidatus Pacearchaeota archaeon]|nr:nucleotidyl transferase AbiEii/AbiGii toxin family protein [Candidatus Pacearchaeota archaeon]